MRLHQLDPADYRDVVARALAEDVRDGDITTDATVGPALLARGVFLIKADCVIAGLEVAFEAFRQLEPGVRCVARKSSAALARCSSASGPRSTSCSGCPASPPARGGSSTQPAGASPSSTPARRPRRCACWRSTRSAPAARRTIASACSTRS